MTAPVGQEAIALARAWRDQDPDDETRAALDHLIARAEAGDGAASAELSDRFAARLAFGTAGLRGELGAGSNRMNRVLVSQAAAGLGAYVLAQAGSAGGAADARGEAGAAPLVVIGYDGRRNSDVFARDSAEIMAGMGLRVVVLPRLLPTPVLAFAVRHLGADAGVMVTASHNPPNDNGYKVYLGGVHGGSQIVAPADTLIAAEIQRVADTLRVDELPRSDGWELAGEAVVDAYVAATARVAPAGPGAAGLRWVYTAMHGVGWETLSKILATAGYPEPVLVEQQTAPDGRFPTVAFPNPEEPGAMDLAFETARAAGAELVVANDPDADRLAVAVPDAAAEGGWRRLTGNQIGLLLGWRAARAAAADAGRGPAASLACSLVSSPGLETVARHYGLDFHATLTGFKWISRAPGIVYGFEEALGYLVNPETVRDKDGISAAIALLGIVTEARAEGRTLADVLREFDETFGFFASDQISVRVDDLSAIDRVMAALRADPPRRIGTVAVERFEDLSQGVGDLPPGDVLRLWLAQGARVIVRPSGTEPKLKLYLDVRGSSSADAAAQAADLAAGARALLAQIEGR